MEQFPSNNQEVSEQDRDKLSALFLELLQQCGQKFEEQTGELLRKGVGEESTEANKNLIIFTQTLNEFIENPKIPELTKQRIRISLENLTPTRPLDSVMREMIPEYDSYASAIEAVLETLEGILNKDVINSLYAYARKIFVPPAIDYAKQQREDLLGE